MRRILDRIIPEGLFRAFALSVIFASVLLAALFKLPYVLFQVEYIGQVNGFFNLYGTGVFIFYPFFVGLLPVVVMGYHNPRTIGQSIATSMLALFCVGISILLYSIEGAICIAMASPLCIVIALIGSVAGYNLQKRFSRQDINVFSSSLLFLLIIPSVSYFENGYKVEPTATPLTTRIVIDAPPEKVWKNVVEFPELAPPTELIFKTGIAYPIRARIEGSGVGAIRYCEFSTGAFVEPITVWDENTLLEFSVDEQPIPMRELSPYGELDTPHLHNFFVSKKGQFKLTKLENGQTMLEGTTWYYHKISPEIYWRLWSEEIIHTIHRRVLEHIKERSENE